MRLYERPRSPYWWVQVTVSGKTYRFSTKRTNKREARSVAEAFVREKLDASQLGVQEELTIREALDRLIAASRGLKDLRNVENRADKLTGIGSFSDRWYINPNTPLHEITSATVDKLRTARAAEGNAPNTINREVALLQRVYNLARDTWGVRVAPGVQFPKHKVRGKLRYLSPEEEEALLAELDPSATRNGLAPPEKRDPTVQRMLQDQYDLVVFLLDTGCRYSEATETVWECVDTRTWRTINIYRDKVGNDGLLPVSKRLQAVLERRWRARPNSPYLFPGKDLTRPRGHATRGIRAAMERAGINADYKVRRYGKATIHTLRDTFASRLAEAGYPLHKIQKLLGHTTPTMTQKYAKFSERAAAEEAAEVLNGLREVV